jgi:hypothetical protein
LTNSSASRSIAEHQDRQRLRLGRRVIVVGVCVRDDDVDRETVALVEVIEGLDLSGLPC